MVSQRVRGPADTPLIATDTLDSRLLLSTLAAVKKGDFSVRLPAEWTGLAGRISDTFNDVIERNEKMAQELERVSRLVGKEGKTRERASIGTVAGAWATSIDSVNTLIGDLVQPTSEMARVIGAVAGGDLSQTMALEIDGRPLAGEFLRTAKTVNTMVGQLGSFASEVTRVAREVGTEGKLGGQADVPGVAGTWKDLTDNVNSMAGNLTAQVRNIAAVTTAVANGDLSKKITVDVQGEILELKNTINTMVDQLNSFASEVTRVAGEVGTEGKLGGQAQVKGVSGTWKDLTDNVNSMAGSLTSQVRDIAAVTTAVANGDLSKKITVDVRGEILELKNTINTMVDQLNSFASEVTRVAREVGTEGKLGGQAEVRGVAGTWKDLTDNVNSMAGSLTSQVRDIAAVTTAVANGDLSKKITVNVRGEILELKDTINTMVDQLNSFASEVTRVAREVGTEGKLGGQAEVGGVAGTWKDLTDSVNFMAGSLTSQVRDIADVTTAVANGDLSRKITVDVRGEILELKDTINTMVDQLNSFASEVTRVAREVGAEGKLGGQADVRGVAGTWKDLTDSVNFMAGSLTSQVRDIADVTTAVANGDLSKKITVDVRGEILELKNTINTMVDQLSSFAAEVTRVAREVGTEGKLGGQAQVKGVSGTWKDLTDNVNSMAGNLTGQVRNIADVTTAVANGDLSKKITVDVRGEILELKNTINIMVDQLNSFASEVTRVAREVGTEGKLGGQANVPGVAGTWKDLTDNVNSMAGNLTAQVRNIAAVTTAVANGDLSKKITVDVRGEILELKDTINTMVDQLSSFAAEVTRVAREVGTEGKLGGQAEVRGVAGTWKDLTDNVNSMAGNLTGQVRGIAKVVTAVADGDLKQKLSVEAKGEIASLADTINNMIDTLATFADQVTTVAREVGVEGRLGGQASVPGAAGTWKDLTDNVNQLAANLTNQVRAIAEVATAVTEGDLTRSIRVEAKGEVAALSDNINQMIANLRETTLKNSEQDWLKTNLARFSRILQGQKDLLTVARMILSELAPLVSANHGVFYSMDTSGEEARLKLLASYAYRERKSVSNEFRLGEGIVGQSALEKERILLTNVPADYIQINSGLGAAVPFNIIVLPVVFENEVKAVIELASFERFSATHQVFLDQLTESIGIVLNTIEANMRTESLLTQSQSLATELQSQQEELQQTNEELAVKAQLLAEQNAEVERKNREVEQAKQDLEEKAEQLAFTSKYKSEFMANMSHELRTPLNSLLILSEQLLENPEGNLSAKQMEYARTIRSSGTDLFTMINDILDLSKIESGTVTVEQTEISFAELSDYVDRTFRYLAEAKGLKFDVSTRSQGSGSNNPQSIYTDTMRLQQVLKNLISNAIKFTEKGYVTLKISPVTSGWSHDQEELNRSQTVIAFEVKDTGIGISKEKQQLVFEAFQQADGTTSRRYGGTGLGLSISRGIAQLLGGEIRLNSIPGEGSTFTLYLPDNVPASPDTDVLQLGSGNGHIEGEGYLAGYPQPDTGPEPAKDSFSSSPAHSSAHRELANRSTRENGGRAERELEPVDGRNEGRRMETKSYRRPEIEDDREVIGSKDQVLLIIEDDTNFVRVLLDRARAMGFKGLVAQSGDAALSLVRHYRPHAITLDLHLPQSEGWSVLERLKNDPRTRHIPVHIISIDEQRGRGLMLGALAFLTKPVTKEALDATLGDLKQFAKRRVGKLLIVQNDETQRNSIVDLIGEGDVKTTAVATGAEALAALKEEPFDCMVLDPVLPDMTGFRLIEEIKKQLKLRDLPVIVYTGKELTTKEQTQLRRLAESVIVKGVQSPERLVDETAIFLHRAADNMPARQRKMVEELHRPDAALAGKRVLVVDDDVRNLFAMTTALERFNMDVLNAENGRDAIEILEQRTDIDAVLMDIMMPEMDGYSTLRAIRGVNRLKKLPIIAITAKAMKGDREKCIEAGASDYVAKPVETSKLVSVLKELLSVSG